MLRFIKPLEPTLVDAPPAGPGWLHTIKQDGYPHRAGDRGGKCRAFTRRGNDWTANYRPIVEAAQRLKYRSAIVDGEMVVQDERGLSDFGALRSAISKRPDRLIFFAFDLLHLNGEDLRSRPIEERRAKLGELLVAADQRLAFSDAFEGDGSEFFKAAEGHGLEGIISKRKGSRYKSGPSNAWLKTKAVETGDDVIGASVTPTGIPVAVLAKDGVHVGSAMINLKADERGVLGVYRAA
jgi:ATP-dependent DNA ligase